VPRRGDPKAVFVGIADGAKSNWDFLGPLGAPHANLVAWLGRMQARRSMKARTRERLSEIAQAA
jgi:hypothetical protein